MRIAYEIFCTAEKKPSSTELSESVIPKIAALAGRDHGDARKAVDTLYEAGRSAEAKNADQVNERHVDEAIEEAEIKRMQNWFLVTLHMEGTC